MEQAREIAATLREPATASQVERVLARLKVESALLEAPGSSKPPFTVEFEGALGEVRAVAVQTVPTAGKRGGSRFSAVEV